MMTILFVPFYAWDCSSSSRVPHCSQLADVKLEETIGRPLCGSGAVAWAGAGAGDGQDKVGGR